MKEFAGISTPFEESIESRPQNSTSIRTIKSNDRSNTTYIPHYHRHHDHRHFHFVHDCGKNVLFLLLPLLMMILSETSALPSIIKIGKFA